MLSERLRMRALHGESEDGGGCCGGKDWPGDASLLQTSVPGQGDGCGVGPEGDANES